MGRHERVVHMTKIIKGRSSDLSRPEIAGAIAWQHDEVKYLLDLLVLFDSDPTGNRNVIGGAVANSGYV